MFPDEVALKPFNVQRLWNHYGNVLKYCQQGCKKGCWWNESGQREVTGNGPSYFHSLSPFMETLLEQGSVLMEEEKVQEKRVRQTERILKGSRGRGERFAEVPFLSIFLGKEAASCVSFIVLLSLWQVAQKPPFIYPEHLVLLRRKKGT